MRRSRVGGGAVDLPVAGGQWPDELQLIADPCKAHGHSTRVSRTVDLFEVRTGALRAWVEVRLSSKQMEEASGGERVPVGVNRSAPVVDDIDLYMPRRRRPVRRIDFGPAETVGAIRDSNRPRGGYLVELPERQALGRFCLRGARSTHHEQRHDTPSRNATARNRRNI